MSVGVKGGTPAESFVLRGQNFMKNLLCGLDKSSQLGQDLTGQDIQQIRRWSAYLLLVSHRHAQKENGTSNALLNKF